MQPINYKYIHSHPILLFGLHLTLQREPDESNNQLIQLQSKKKKSKLQKHIVFSWKTTTKSAELAGELTELFRTSVKTKCHHPLVTDDVKWGLCCPRCPLGHPSLVLARKQSGDAQGSLGWVLFFLMGVGSPQNQVVDAETWGSRVFSPRQRSRSRQKSKDPFADSGWWFPRCLYGHEDIRSWASWGSLLTPALIQNGRRNEQREEDGTCWQAPDLVFMFVFFSIPTASRDGDGFLKTIHSTYTKPRRVSGYFRWQNLVIPLVGVKIFP